MDYLKPSALLCLSALMVGCAGTPLPSKPPAGDVISIHHVGTGDWKARKVSVFKDDYDCYGVEPQAPEVTNELLIERKVYTTVLVHWVSDMGTATCDVVQTFRTGEESEFKVLSDGTYSWPGSCKVGILRKLKDGSWQQVEGFRREYDEPWWSGGLWSFCEADPVYKGSSLLLVPRGEK